MSDLYAALVVGKISSFAKYLDWITARAVKNELQNKFVDA